ncbi:MAG: hypothetical protein A2234_00715 [Elusimicrobia bacterium RIFOXYA2_FULL_58_8]|nr:MAG: hypothetical protein A2285_06160 [Elusimicrobia bacterium RIFOXYA12_FULL_57_11]OGS12201.1 MAG: hypothetical protein A2234_00715 [Elusimicrobia bacterium RIFOXYA2_FULL_58_8]
MKPDKEQGELENFIKETSDNEPQKTAANREVLARFMKAGAEIPPGAMERVRASLESRPAAAPWFYRKAAPALALCAVAVAAVILTRPSGEPVPLVSPDWRSYENFPYYAAEGRLYVSGVSPDWRSADTLVIDAASAYGL